MRSPDRVLAAAIRQVSHHPSTLQVMRHVFRTRVSDAPEGGSRDDDPTVRDRPVRTRPPKNPELRAGVLPQPFPRGSPPSPYADSRLCFVAGRVDVPNRVLRREWITKPPCVWIHLFLVGAFGRHRSLSFLLLSVASVSNRAERFDCTSITLRALSSSRSRRSFSLRSRAASRWAGPAAAGPETLASACRVPCGRECRPPAVTGSPRRARACARPSRRLR